ncbi:hypothetical protein DK37_17160 [Halomonas sp. SUBG004]|nr:hypothetical protein DK37_17160 [Halomonas sp. SUBG004]
MGKGGDSSEWCVFIGLRQKRFDIGLIHGGLSRYTVRLFSPSPKIEKLAPFTAKRTIKTIGFPNYPFAALRAIDL